MPIYTWKCKDCEHEEDYVRTIENMEELKQIPCESCGSMNRYHKISNVMTVDPYIAGRLRVPKNLENRIDQIKRTHGTGKKSIFEK